jgi:biotin carboxyl carrier protein
MQNVLRAERAGRVKRVLFEAGAHLKIDEVIVEFEDEG